MSAQVDTHAHQDDHGHHPKETFITKVHFLSGSQNDSQAVFDYWGYYGCDRDFNVFVNAYANCMAYRTKCNF